jgi:hypothetical protein
MLENSDLLHANEARVAAAAGVVVEALGLCTGEAFEWVMDASGLTGIPLLELADLVVCKAARDALPLTI